MSELTVLFDRHGSDKGSAMDGHFYSLDYERLVPRETTALLEVGIGTAFGFNGLCGSIRAWLDWITGTVYGFDLYQPMPDVWAHPRFRFTQGDQGNRDDLERLRDAIPMLDVIIDDGSHFSPHQLLTFDVLWDRLKPGGHYVVEDVYIGHQDFEWLRVLRAMHGEEPPNIVEALTAHPAYAGTIGRDGHGIVLTKPVP
jgi:hypothetical protein